MTLSKLIELISSKYAIDNTPCKRTYILPDGKFIHLSTTWGHQGIKTDLKNEFNLSSKDVELEDYGCIRVNFDAEGFIELPTNRPTDAQYDSLTKLFDLYLSPSSYFDYGSGDRFMIIEPCNYEERMSNNGQYPKDLFHYYYFKTNGYTSDDYIKLIKMYYTTGKLFEKLEDL